MNYSDVRRAVFLSRPNRFIAHCLVDGEEVVAHVKNTARCRIGGEEVVAHVKNTGRCRELLLPGATVWLQHHDNPARKTSWSLIAVQKGERLINMDSQAPNEIAAEAIMDGTLAPSRLGTARCGAPGSKVRRLPIRHLSRKSRQAGLRRGEGGHARAGWRGLFPRCAHRAGRQARPGALYGPRQKGYGAFILFVIQMENVRFFAPNDETHPAFGEALREAAKKVVGIVAADCFVKPDEVRLKSIVPVKL